MTSNLLNVVYYPGAAYQYLSEDLFVPGRTRNIYANLSLV